MGVCGGWWVFAIDPNVPEYGLRQLPGCTASTGPYKTATHSGVPLDSPTSRGFFRPTGSIRFALVIDSSLSNGSILHLRIWQTRIAAILDSHFRRP